jgi:uncharacterized membrane protein YeaQ/YmgE (transglycosylase-associated protein family)
MAYAGGTMENAAVEGSSLLYTIIVWIVVGGIAGWLAGLVVKGMGFGLVGNIVLGIVGAIVAGWLLPKIGISLGSGLIGAIIAAAIGAIIVLVIVGLIKRA